MYNIAIVGVGQLGSRHLQGLAALDLSVKIHLVDPSEASIRLAKSRFLEKTDALMVQKLETHSSVFTLPKHIDLAIVATTADRRMEAMAALCSHAFLRYFILEKVLFQRFDDYDRAQKLLTNNGIRAWVNCPRRIYPLYRDLQSWFANDPVRNIRIYGGAWGLGCNAVHFVDLFAYLTGNVIREYDTSGMDPDPIHSTRAGTFEYTGTLRGNSTNCSIELTSLRNSRLRHILTIESSNRHLTIDETAGAAWSWSGDEGSELLKLNNRFQSELTGDLVRQILVTGQCGLTEYSESSTIHLHLLRSLARIGDVHQADFCRVT